MKKTLNGRKECCKETSLRRQKLDEAYPDRMRWFIDSNQYTKKKLTQKHVRIKRIFFKFSSHVIADPFN
jgi:hypothetical protein